MVSIRKAKKEAKKLMQNQKIQSTIKSGIPNKNATNELCITTNDEGIKVAVFFDTNKLEARFSNSKCGDLYLAEVKASNDFYEIKKYIEDNGLLRYVKLCITEISIREYKQHLIESFREHSKGFSDNIEGYKKAFGSILDVTFEFRKSNEDEFKEHIETIFEEFLSLNKCEIIEYVRDIDFFNNLVDKAIKKQKPFTVIGGNNKLYKDAGFKDAIVGETIIKYHEKRGHKCILVTNDNDFISAFQDYDDILICKESSTVKGALFRLLGVSNLDLIKYKFEADKYIQERIIGETGNGFDESVTNFDVVNVMEEEENLYSIQIESEINEVIYHITCNYESISNEIFDVEYTTEND